MAAHGGPGAVVARRPGRRLAAAEPRGRGPADYLEEGTPLRPLGNVDLKRAFWRPTALLAVSSAEPGQRPAGKISSGGVTSPAPT